MEPFIFLEKSTALSKNFRNYKKENDDFMHRKNCTLVKHSLLAAI